jgi:hypothetical protein
LIQSIGVARPAWGNAGWVISIPHPGKYCSGGGVSKPVSVQYTGIRPLAKSPNCTFTKVQEDLEDIGEEGWESGGKKGSIGQKAGGTKIGQKGGDAGPGADRSLIDCANGADGSNIGLPLSSITSGPDGGGG